MIDQKLRVASLNVPFTKKWNTTSANLHFTSWKQRMFDSFAFKMTEMNNLLSKLFLFFVSELINQLADWWGCIWTPAVNFSERSAGVGGLTGGSNEPNEEEEPASQHGCHRRFETFSGHPAGLDLETMSLLLGPRPQLCCLLWLNDGGRLFLSTSSSTNL